MLPGVHLILNIVLISLFGAIGVLLRFGANSLFYSQVYIFLPTLLVNALGSLLIGILYAAHNEGFLFIPQSFYLPLMVGLLGGLTTFSGFSLETLKLINSGAVGLAALNITLQIVVSLGLCSLGMKAVTFSH